MSVTANAATRGRVAARRRRNFTFSKGDLVLVKWADGMVYFAKIKHIYHRREKCIVVFDDKSQDEADFSQIHGVDETTTDIICIKCKKDDSDAPNEIVLCDNCCIGFHQKCHTPMIPASALQLDSPWNCSYCLRDVKCPYLTESLDVLQNLLSDDNESHDGGKDETNGVDAEGDDVAVDDTTGADSGAGKRRSLRNETKNANSNVEKRKSLRNSLPAQVSSLATTERKYVLGEKSQNGSNNCEDSSFSEEEENPATESVSGNKKRKKYGPYHKRQKRSSVESHTVSVTWSNSSIFSNSSNGCRSLKENEGDQAGRSDVSKSRHDKRSLRVSLSLPEDVEKKLSLKSPVLSSGVQQDLVSPTADVVKVSPVEEEHKDCEAFQASSLPVVTSVGQAETGPSSSSEIALPSIDKSKTESPMETQSDDMDVSESAVISSCKSPPAEVPADSSTTDKCLPGTNILTAQPVKDSSIEEMTEMCEDTKPTSNRVDAECTSYMEEKETVTPAVLTATEVDATAAVIPTTLPVIIGRSKFLASTTQAQAVTEVVSPTKATASSEDCACEAGDGSCAQLTPISTNSSGVFEIGSYNKEAEDVASPKQAGNHLDKPTSLVDENDSSEQAMEVEDHGGVESPVAVSEVPTGTNNNTTGSSAKPVPSAPTPVITSAVSTLDPQSRPICNAEDGMSQLDKQLAAVIGYGREDLARGSYSDSDQTMDVEATKVSSVASIKTIEVSNTSKLKEPSVVTNVTAVREEKPAERENNVNVPDVIIMSVEPSKENSARRESAAVRPSSLTGQVASARPTPHLTQTPTEVVITQAPGKGKPPPYPSRGLAAETLAIQSPTPPGSMHQAHAIYSPGSRVPMPYQPLPTSVIFDPNGQPLHREHVQQQQQQDGSLVRQQVGPPPSYAAVSATSKPYTIAKSVPSERVGSRSVDERNYVVVNSRRVISGPALTQGVRVPPDSTIEAESIAGTRTNNVTAVSPSEDKSKLTRKKFAQKDIQYIQKKVGDACNSYDQSMFMSAFNEAWQKFQANAANYEDDHAFKNSGSVTLGQLDQLQHSQLVSTKPKVWAPKLTSCSAEPGDGSAPRSPTFPPLHALPSITQPLQPQPTQQQQQYILQKVSNNHYVYSVPSAVVGNHHPPLHMVQSKPGLSPQTPSTGGSLALVQSRPSPVTQNVSKPPMVPGKPPQMVVSHFRTRLPAQQHQQQQQQLKTNPLPTKRKPRKKCSRCGKDASYICSGCTKEWYCDKECQLADWEPHSKHCQAA